MYQAFSKKGTLFKGDFIQGGTIFEEIRYFYRNVNFFSFKKQIENIGFVKN